MPRNLLIDVAALAGSEVAQLAVVAKRFDRPGSATRDVHGPRKYLHLEVGDAPGNSDFGRSHRHAYEFRRDVPAWGKRRNGDSLFAFDGVPTHESPPGQANARRNMLLDVEEATGSPMLLAAVLVMKRHNGPPPGWGTGPAVIPNPWVPPKPPPMPYDDNGEPLYPEDQWPPNRWDEKPADWQDEIPAPWTEMDPPSEHFGPDTFVHCMVAHDPAMADDLGDNRLRAREFMRGMHPSMRRADGGPLHVFLGNEVYEVKPTPEDIGPGPGPRGRS